MSKIVQIRDRLTNLVAQLGTQRDKAAHSVYSLPFIDDEQLSNAYRGAWMPRKIVDIPALDACRKWRAWQADNDQIEAIEAEENRLNLRRNLIALLKRARLYGGAALYIGTRDLDPSQPLNVQRIGKGGLQHLTLMTRRQLHPGDRDDDPMSPNFGKPQWYEVRGAKSATVRIDPSRLVIMTGGELPDADMERGTFGWGDSVLMPVFDAVRNADSTMGNIASLIFEAKIDVFRIPNFMDCVGDAGYRSKLLERFSLAATAKGINGALLLDKEEEYDSKSPSFATLPELIDRFLQAVSGASDIPATRLLGQSPAGLSSTGESDTRNYYDRIQSMQELEVQPAMAILDECLIRSALGTRPPEVHYIWRPLWQSTAKEQADIGKTTADTIKTLSDTRLFPDEALSKAATNMLVENSVMPGLEAAIAEFDEELPDEDSGAE